MIYGVVHQKSSIYGVVPQKYSKYAKDIFAKGCRLGDLVI